MRFDSTNTQTDPTRGAEIMPGIIIYVTRSVKGTFWAYNFTTSGNRQKLDRFDKAAFCYR